MESSEEVDSPPGQSDQETVDLEEGVWAEHEAIPEHLREEVLARDGHRCRIKGCRGRALNGSARLLVQRIDKDQADNSELSSADLETRCLRCSVWIEKMPTTDDLRPRIKQRLNGVTLEPNRAEILQFLAENGPATTGDILENVSLSSSPGVRQALYSLMGLDVREPDIDQRIVIKNREDQTYGLPWQVPDEHDARGYIPIRPAELRNRILDEFVCRLSQELDGEIDNSQEVVAAVVDRKPEQIRHMRRRGQAFQFPFDRWAGQEQSRDDPSAVIAAVDALADETNNLSRQLLSRNIAAVYESNDEQNLADMLRAWAKSEDISPYVEDQQTTAESVDEETADTSAEADDWNDSTDTDTADHDYPDEDTPRCDMQVLDEATLDSNSTGEERVTGERPQDATNGRTDDDE